MRSLSLAFLSAVAFRLGLLASLLVGFAATTARAGTITATIDTTSIAGKTIFDIFLDTESAVPVTAAYVLTFTGDVPLNQELFAGVAQVNVNDPAGFFPFLTAGEQLADSYIDVTTGMGFGLGILIPGPGEESYEVAMQSLHFPENEAPFDRLEHVSPRGPPLGPVVARIRADRTERACEGEVVRDEPGTRESDL